MLRNLDLVSQEFTTIKDPFGHLFTFRRENSFSVHTIMGTSKGEN